MSLIVPAARFAELLERVESAIESDQFVELRFSPVPERDTDVGQASGKSSAAPTGDRHPLSPVQRSHEPVTAGASTAPATPPAARAPLVTPSPRAPWWRSEQAYTRRGVQHVFRAPPAGERVLMVALWLGSVYFAARVIEWWTR